MGAYPYVERDREMWRAHNDGGKSWDIHLRSSRTAGTDNIQAADGELGHVADFVIDDRTWAIRYIIIDTRNWWPGKKVLISPKWIERVSWNESKAFPMIET